VVVAVLCFAALTGARIGQASAGTVVVPPVGIVGESAGTHGDSGHGSTFSLAGRYGYIDLDFGGEVVGHVALHRVGTGEPISISLSESRQFLGFHSDYLGRARNEAATPCGSRDLCSHFGAFRYARVFVRHGATPVRITEVHAMSQDDAEPTIGSFESSDQTLNQIWASSASTVSLMVSRFSATHSDPRGCGDAWLAGKPVLLDGAKRDRCPYSADVAVSALSELLRSGDGTPIRNVLLGLARMQKPNGFIPPSFIHLPLRLIDYPAWWAVVLHDYVLYTGNIALAQRLWPVLVGVLNRWYPSLVNGSGLIEDPLKRNDYAFIKRTGTVVTYYNALYVLALEDSIEVAKWTGHLVSGRVWLAREAILKRRINRTLWDSSAGAYVDAQGSAAAHPLDGNALAVLTDTSGRSRDRRVLSFLDSTLARPWGTAMVDTSAWDERTRPLAGLAALKLLAASLALGALTVVLRKRYSRIPRVLAWTPAGVGCCAVVLVAFALTHSGRIPSQESFSTKVYPFISYFETEARFDSGHPASGLREIRTTWSSMLRDPTTPGTTWEWIGENADPKVLGPSISLAHGWSTGALPLLTRDVLGIRPVAPGFSRFVVAPYPGNLSWAKGTVPTNSGSIEVDWHVHAGGKLLLSIRAPKHDRVGVKLPNELKAVSVLINGKRCGGSRSRCQIVTR
jgi:hypothetical protein